MNRRKETSEWRSADLKKSDAFRTRAAELGRWLRSADGRLPDRYSTDAHERGLASWRRSQLELLSTGTLAPEREKYLDTAAPGWRPTALKGSEAFRARAEDLGRWLRTAGRPPSSSSTDVHERRLSSWRGTQLRRLNAGTLSPERQEYLVAVAPGWGLPQDGSEAFRARADDLGRWLRSAGRFPSSSSTDAYERRLANWRYDQLRPGVSSPERERYLDEVAPGWRPPASGPEAFRSKAEELGRWIATTDKVPSSTSDDPRERRIGVWRQKQLGCLRHKTLPAEQERYLDEVAPGWRPPPGGAEVFRSKAEELGRWMSSQGTRPSVNGDDQHEKQLAWWRKAQLRKQRAGTLPPEREQYLDQVAPEWRAGPDGKFRARAEELGQWMRSANRVPSSTSGDPHERRLADYRNTRLRELRTRRLSPQREKCLDEVAPGWRSDRGESNFHARADDLGRWMRSEGKVPEHRSDDEHERELARWRYRQLHRLGTGVLSSEREKCLDAVAPQWRPTPRRGPEAFRARAEELGRWMRSAGRLPVYHSGDQHERRLDGWRLRQSMRLRAGKLSPERREYLDAVAPGWRPKPRSGPEAFRASADELGRWFASTDGKVPAQSSDDQRERRIGMWRLKQLARLRTKTLPQECEQYLDEVAAGWRPRLRPRGPDVVGFPARARALGRWMPSADRKVPSGSSDDWFERRLNGWRRTWLRQLRTGTLPSEHEQYLDEVAPGWRPRAGSGIDEFPARAQALGRWFASPDGSRVPSERGDDLRERRLCRWRQGWLFHLRNGTLSPEHEQYLDKVAPGWRPRRRAPSATSTGESQGPSL